MSGNAFLAVPISGEDCHLLAAGLSEASSGHRVPGRRVPPENWHITVRFMGEVDDVTVDRALAELEQTLDVPISSVTLTGLGAFPDPRKAGIVYAGVRDHDNVLSSLAALSEEAVREVGLPAEERPFVPHVTLSRLRPRVNVEPLIASFGDFSVRIPVDRVVLFRSERTTGGLRYREIDDLTLS
ncbi:MAG: RNA 2',3'-cyclic phosphodiesterase [Acidimicrobiia bacterium]